VVDTPLNSKLNSKMAYFLNHFLSRRDDDDELCDLESGEGSGHSTMYPPLPPTLPTPLELDAASMQIETSGRSMHFSQAEDGMQSDPNPKRSRHWDQTDSTKVRIVPQTSRIPTVVSAVTCHMK
jgi:hypothetical protein